MPGNFRFIYMKRSKPKVDERTEGEGDKPGGWELDGGATLQVLEGAEVQDEGIYFLNLSPSLHLVGAQLNALAPLFKRRSLLGTREKPTEYCRTIA